MATDKQIAANRLNAQKNTGPRTPAGKAASRFNALKHGIYAVHQIMFDEKAEDLAELAAEYHEHHSPADPHECLLVETLVHNEWRLRRMRRVEADLWYHAYNAFVVKNIEVTLKCTSGDAFATDSSTFERLQRVVNSCERAYHRALRELQAKVGQALSPANPAAQSLESPQPEEYKPTSASSASFHSNPKAPASAATKWPVVDPDATPFVAPITPAAIPPDRFPEPPDALDAASAAAFKQK